MQRPTPPPSDQMRASGSGRRKVALPPGRSQLDWVRNSSRFQPPRPRPIPLAELRTHNNIHNAWIAIAGKVFDVSHYLEYHPGGIDMILAGAGKDGTKLFNKYHPWVNPDFMLSRCYLGTLDSDDTDTDTSSHSSTDPQHPTPDTPPETDTQTTEDVVTDDLDALRLAEVHE